MKTRRSKRIREEMEQRLRNVGFSEDDYSTFPSTARSIFRDRSNRLCINTRKRFKERRSRTASTTIKYHTPLSYASRIGDVEMLGFLLNGDSDGARDDLFIVDSDHDFDPVKEAKTMFVYRMITRYKRMREHSVAT